MFGKKEKKIAWVLNASDRDKQDGQLKIVKLGLSREKQTITEMEEQTLESVKLMFDQIRKNTKGHDIEIGTFVMPMIHVVHEDDKEAIEDQKWQENKAKILKYYD